MQTKKTLLKKMVKGARKIPKTTPQGISPVKTDNGLGNRPAGASGDKVTGGGGSNLGTARVF